MKEKKKFHFSMWWKIINSQTPFWAVEFQLLLIWFDLFVGKLRDYSVIVIIIICKTVYPTTLWCCCCWFSIDLEPLFCFIFFTLSRTLKSRYCIVLCFSFECWCENYTHIHTHITEKKCRSQHNYQNRLKKKNLEIKFSKIWKIIISQPYYSIYFFYCL